VIDGVSNHRLDLRLVQNVGLDEAHIGAELGRKCLSLLAAATGNDDKGAFFRE
jgi:hypothetical protein